MNGPTLPGRWWTRKLLARLAVEALLGSAFAAILLIVAWASSNAIHFVYGGY